jgi:hypothetical protein
MSTDKAKQTDPSRAKDPASDEAPAKSTSSASGEAPKRGAGRSTRERAEEKRQEKLELVQQQVDSGSLVIRSMTEEERERYPPRAERPNQRRGR